MSETAFEAQRRKLRGLKEKQDAGEETHPDTHISVKAQARRNAETAAAKPTKKKAKKKTT